jgi:glucose/arabinose dehydrogenase
MQLGLARRAALLAGVALMALATTASAHPPSAPFDDTIFAPIRPGGPRIAVETVATGLTAPNKAVAAPGEPRRLYVVDQPGRIWAIDLDTGLKTLFLDVGSRLVPLGVFGPNTFDERGLLGVAFHPGYATNGLLYTYTSEPTAGPPSLPSTMPAGVPPDHQNVVAEWRAAVPGMPALGVIASSRRELIRMDHPQFNHDGGELAFGPDGNLYVSVGDGGNADDEGPGHLPGGNAQSLRAPLGKILRIDPDGRSSANGQYDIPADNPFAGVAGAVAEIYALGFRNPFRFSFDSLTGELYVGDVGQNDIEEVDVVTRGGNYGWATKEGTLFFYGNGDAAGFASTVDNGLVPAGAIDPIAQYDTHHEGHSVIGGFVYRGAAMQGLHGRYVFGDFSRVFRFPSGPNDRGRLFVLAQRQGTKLRQINELHFAGDGGLGSADRDGTEGAALGLSLLGIGSDAAGELYALGNTDGVPFGTDGRVLRLVPAG